jgi:hypothetical protein
LAGSALHHLASLYRRPSAEWPTQKWSGVETCPIPYIPNCIAGFCVDVMVATIINIAIPFGQPFSQE